MQPHPVSLDDKYCLTDGEVYITGSQALVRLAMMQLVRDKDRGLDTSCYISGYRGSPMHNLDKELWRAARFLDGSSIHFHPGVNEDLAATAIWGTQQVNALGDARCDGVFSMWYGKGPGLDRSMDAIRHGHMAGSSANGGVLVVVGDDHALSSTDAPAAHEYAFVELMMPLLYPANLQDILDYGLLGWAMSRYCGAWVGFKVIPDTVDASSAIVADPWRPDIKLPGRGLGPELLREFPEGGLNLRVPDFWYLQEPRHRDHKLAAALAFGRANSINKVTLDSPNPRFGIIATGKAWTDVGQGLLELGLDDKTAADLGITVLKLGMPYPFDAQTVREFASGLEEVVVVEEKVDLTETNVRAALYGLPDGRRPRVLGREDENGNALLPTWPELNPEHISRALEGRISRFHSSEKMKARIAFINEKTKASAQREMLEVQRTPYFCSGCPHNSSTRVPEGSRAHGGVGCHFMSTYMDRENITHCHMGGEGATWIGQSPFSTTDHVFQNLGDGTYFHSGLLAIRACVAANVNITYKILFNDAVAMTGGQPIDGVITPQIISNQVYAEGVRKVFVVSDEPEKYPSASEFAAGTTVAHRNSLDAVQRECREHRGVSVLIYDQTCAAEKRRRRKRGSMVDPSRRMLINQRVCEGCGECNAKSNCLSVVPVDTTFGRKRQIDQSACNKDYSCAEGFCPSFVSVYGGKPKRSAVKVSVPPQLLVLPEPSPRLVEPGRAYSVLVTGVGGTGVVTIGALLTMAAHMEGKAFSAVDQFGMAQKGGAVTSHLRIAATSEDIRAVRINAGAADVILGCDSLVTAGELALNAIEYGRTHVIMNTHEQITGQFARNPDLAFPVSTVNMRVRATAGAEHADLIDATQIATRLLGDSIATNLFMLGFAYQKGLVPVAGASIERAIELNAVAVDMNTEAFLWGRRAAWDWAAVEALALRTVAAEPGDGSGRQVPADTSVDALVEHRADELVAYQNEAYAARYRSLVADARKSEDGLGIGRSDFSEAVARYGYKLMAYKDEYEVARHYTDGSFMAELRRRFDGDISLKFHLAPPLLARKDPHTGLPAKRTFGGWLMPVLKVVASLRGLRGTPLDLFGYSAERRTERALIAEYEMTVRELCQGLSPRNYDDAVGVASVPEQIRGYGYVKDRHIAQAAALREAQLAAWRRPHDERAAA